MIHKIKKTVEFLKNKDKILFLLTSNRWSGHEEIPKSSQLAFKIKEKLKNKNIEIIDVSKLKIYNCEGNISSKDGNNCGTKESLLKDKTKNPSGNHRCWCSINNQDDELWKISKALLESDCVVFFGSVRWGKMNSIYANLLERLTWLENRHTTLKEDNLLENISCGIISIGHNWNGDDVIKIEKNILTFFGFLVENDLCWSYQWTDDKLDESLKVYKKDSIDFNKILKSIELIK